MRMMSKILAGGHAEHRLLQDAGFAPSRGRTRRAPAEQAPGLGEVMVQVARRFEVAGRAGRQTASSWLPSRSGNSESCSRTTFHARACPRRAPRLRSLRWPRPSWSPSLRELTRAAAIEGSSQRSAAAFEHAAAMCNACHVSAAKGFIQVPSVPGQSVPVVDPLPAPYGSDR